MRLILRQYLASLRERDELDAVLPDLLNQLGLTVFSRPGRGTRQDGVDVAAVGKLKGDAEEKVYLFSIKPGDLTRGDWEGGSVQALRPSLRQIQDAYIPNRLPVEHRGKKIVICICLGGTVLEQVRPDVEGFIERESADDVAFEEWNGDKIAALIEERFLREDLLPEDARPMLRKALAMLDEPESSYGYFAALVRKLAAVDDGNHQTRTRSVRQICICLWVLYAWGRDAGNMESPYRCSELALLSAWHVVSLYAGKKTKSASAVREAFQSILQAYLAISSEYLSDRILPHVGKRDGLSSAVRGGCALDINRKLFDVLGRVAMKGIWMTWLAQHVDVDGKVCIEAHQKALSECHHAIGALISNNPTLLLPRADEQAIDIWITVAFLSSSGAHMDIRVWLKEIAERAAFAYRTHGLYPCNLNTYRELLEHPREKSDAYREDVTRGSILYPMIAFWAAALGDDALYADVAHLSKNDMPHCSFQFWFPDETSETHMYRNTDAHGATLAPVSLEQTPRAFLEQIFGECDQSHHFRDLSAVKVGFWPIILVACRHYRLPLPIHLFEGLRGSREIAEATTRESEQSADT